MAEMLFNPRARDQAVQDGRSVGSWKEVQKAALKFRNEIVEERRVAGAKTPDIVPVAHRRTGEVRWFNLANEYAGWLNHAEACLRGEWRLATPEEEQGELAKIAAARQAATDAKLAKLAEAHAQSALAAFARQHIQNQAASAQSGELAKSNSKTK